MTILMDRRRRPPPDHIPRIVSPPMPPAPPVAQEQPVVMGDPTTVPEQPLGAHSGVSGTPYDLAPGDVTWVSLPRELDGFFELGFVMLHGEVSVVFDKATADELVGSPEIMRPVFEAGLTLCDNLTRHHPAYQPTDTELARHAAVG